MTREELAGLLSTLDFRPAGNHPQDCLPMADAILAALPVPPAGTREAVAWMYTDTREIRDDELRQWVSLKRQHVHSSFAHLKETPLYALPVPREGEAGT